MCMSADTSGADAATAAEAARQDQIRQGQASIDSAFSGFDQGFYDKISKAYTDYQQPSFDRQAADAKSNLEYGLERAGIENSSAAAKQKGDLLFDTQSQQQALTDQATQAATTQRQQVENARSSVEAQLSADANAGVASSASSARAAQLAMMPAFSPIGTLFSNVTSGLSAAGQGNGLFTTPTGTVGNYAPGAYSPVSPGASIYGAGTGGAPSYTVR
jgi:hypothetical protein